MLVSRYPDGDAAPSMLMDSTATPLEGAGTYSGPSIDPLG
jgi:hypothetical protein